MFDAFLHYIYGSDIRLLPLYKDGKHVTGTGTSIASVSSGGGVESGITLLDGMEATPDTSVTSVDENDLTEEYDKYASNDPLDDFADVEVTRL